MPSSIALVNGTSRTCAAMVSPALAAGDTVHAVVRSRERFLAAHPLHADEPRLVVHEVRDFTSVQALRPVVARVDHLFVTLSAPAFDKPTTLYSEVVHACVAAIRAETTAAAAGTSSSGGKSGVGGEEEEEEEEEAGGDKALASPRTKITFLTAVPLVPRAPTSKYPDRRYVQPGDRAGWLERLFRYGMLRGPLDDMEQAQHYLSQQSAWGLRWTIVLPGGISDTSGGGGNGVPESDELLDNGWRLDTRGANPGAIISYDRLARAMLVAAKDSKYDAEYVVPFVDKGLGAKGKNDAAQLIGSFLGEQLRTILGYATAAAVGAAAAKTFL